MSERFLTRSEVALELNVSEAQVYALIRRRDLRAAKIGGRGTWRIGRDDLEAFIETAYEQTARWIAEHPFTEDDEPLEEPPAGDDLSNGRRSLRYRLKRPQGRRRCDRVHPGPVPRTRSTECAGVPS